MNVGIFAAVGVGVVAFWRWLREAGGGSAVDVLPVDDWAASEPPTTCDPSPKPGVQEFRRFWIGRHGERPGSPENISRDCAVGGNSEHKEGRAWDWMIPGTLADAQAALDTLTADDGALLRRAGIMYMIFNRRMWRSYSHPAGARTWTSYTGPNPHTDHAHFSFSRDGAMGRTTLYSKPIA